MIGYAGTAMVSYGLFRDEDEAAALAKNMDETQTVIYSVVIIHMEIKSLQEVRSHDKYSFESSRSNHCGSRHNNFIYT